MVKCDYNIDTLSLSAKGALLTLAKLGQSFIITRETLNLLFDKRVDRVIKELRKGGIIKTRESRNSLTITFVPTNADVRRKSALSRMNRYNRKKKGNVDEPN